MATNMATQESKVEITGFLARHYDELINFFSLGSYPIFIRRAIQRMNIQPADHILDLGCGTGRNACLMAKYLAPEGMILGLDIGEEMIQQFQQKCRPFHNVHIQKMRIDEPLPFQRFFDKVLISFVFHGFPDDKKAIIIDNARRALNPGGSLFILDYNEFDLGQKNILFRWGFKKFECRLAQDYLKIDWKKWLSDRGFHGFEEYLFYGRIIRLLRAEVKN